MQIKVIAAPRIATPVPDSTTPVAPPVAPPSTAVPSVPPLYNADLDTKLLSAVPVTNGVALHPAVGQVLQCCVWVPSLGRYFTSQAQNGTNGTETPYQNCVLSRLNSSGTLIDSMVLQDAGHGTSFGVNVENGVPVIYMNYQSSDNDLISFPYAAGTYNRDTLGSVTVWPKPDAGYDNLQFDWDSDLLVIRNSSGTRDSYIRRKISEWKAGVNKTYGRVDLQQGPPVLQGFCTMNDALFRYIGAGSNGKTVADRTTYIQQYSWNSTKRIDQRDFTSLGKTAVGTYPGGTYEPESCTMYREADGTATLIFTVTFGVYPNHTYQVYKLSKIGSPVVLYDPTDPAGANENTTQSTLG